MARQVIPLTDKKIKNAKPAEKTYKIFDGGGLYVEIRKSGKKIFRLKYKNKTYTIGEYPVVTLAEARKKAEEIKKSLFLGIDIRKKGYTFEEVTKEFLTKAEKELSPKYFKSQVRKLENYVLPFIGGKEIEKITKADIVKVLKNVKNVKVPLSKPTDKTEATRRVFILLRQIFKYAYTNDYIQANIIDKINIDDIIPKRKVEHIEAVIDEEELKHIVKDIFSYDRGYVLTRLAFKFLILTAIRSGNVRNLRWEWINFKERVIMYPASAMKAKKEFRLPLTNSLVEILKEAKKYSRGKIVFHSPKEPNKQLSDMTFNMILRRLGIENHKPHGFRSSFSTICYKYMHEHRFSAEVIETQLAHSVGNAVMRAYMRGDFLEERRKLLEWWEGFILSDF